MFPTVFEYRLSTYHWQNYPPTDRIGSDRSLSNDARDIGWCRWCRTVTPAMRRAQLSCRRPPSRGHGKGAPSHPPSFQYLAWSAAAYSTGLGPAYIAANLWAQRPFPRRHPWSRDVAVAPAQDQVRNPLTAMTYSVGTYHHRFISGNTAHSKHK